jgi:hypothetical protein
MYVQGPEQAEEAMATMRGQEGWWEGFICGLRGRLAMKRQKKRM